MALLNFKYGSQSNLPVFNHDNDGNVYVTADKQRMFITLPGQSDYVGLGDFELVSWTKSTTETDPNTALAKCTLKRTNILYLTVETSSNATAMWRYTGSSFVAISNSEEISAIMADIEALETSLADINTKILHYGTCMTAATAPAKVVTCSNFKLYTGALIAVQMKYPNGAGNATLNVNDTGAKTIKFCGQNLGGIGYGSQVNNMSPGYVGNWCQSDTVLFVYDGTYWQIIESGATYKAGVAQATANLALPKSGGVMTGKLTLSGDPTADLHATTKQYVDNAITKIDATVTNLSTSIGNLSNIMNFVGITETEIEDGTTSSINTPSSGGDNWVQKAGDVVVDKNGKECVYDGSVWRVIGDTSAQNTAITALQNTVGTKPTGTEIPDMDDTLWEEVSDLRTDLGEKTDSEDKTTTAFGRIAALEAWKTEHSTAYTNLEGRMTEAEADIGNIITVLTWGTF